LGFLDKLRGRKSTQEAPVAKEASPCLHIALAPRWDDPADMGVEAKVSAWTCGACNETFTPAQAQELRASEAERLKQTFRTN
jgi:hypothetical protein